MQEMISVTWNDLPGTVRRHLIEYYSQATDTSAASIMERVCRDNELGWMTPVDGSHHLSLLLFTPVQYTLFLLKWS